MSRAIEFQNVSFSYGGDARALNDVSFSVEKGEFVAVLGHNGSGKSTLARLVNGLLSPKSGKITVLGMDAGSNKNIFEIRKNVGIVFQNPDNQTVSSIVEDDIVFGPENIGLPREEIGKRIEFALSAVGMEKFRHATPERLSGGQKQRIAIAGVLALKPQIMILDESTAMLDPKGRKEVLDVVTRLNKEEHITVLMITHFPEEAMKADRAIVLNRGEIVMQGSPQEVLTDGEKLETFNLALPLPIALCRALKAGGIDVEDTLNPEVLAKEISEALEGGEGLSEEVQEEGKKGYSGEHRSVHCEHLSYTYNANSPFASHALKDVSLEIGEGEFFGIIGHTGSGKSTFVQHLNALIKVPTAEKKYKPKKPKKGMPLPPKTVLTVDGFDLTDKRTDFFALRSDVGMVFQYPEYQLFAETVFEDVAFGLKNFKKELGEAELVREVKEAIETVGLCYEEVKNKSPFELSGGQKRRAAIAGVIVTKPRILVLDEPAAGLDPLGKREIMQLLQKIHKEWCKTVIIVSHDMDEIAENCTGAAVFSEGTVAEQGTPKALFESADRLFSIGLDVPFTAKVVRALKERGVTVTTDFRVSDFLEKILALKGGRQNA